MKYHSPLHIFDGKNISFEDANSLKKLRQEMLLQFDLQQQTTIKINGAEYDKAAILSFFEELKTDGEFHWRVYKNKDLLNFLEKGDFQFFSNSNNWKELEDPAFQAWVAPYFIEKLSESIYKCAEEKGFRSMNRLHTLNKSGFPMSDEIKDQVYAKAFSFLNKTVAAAMLAAINPFIENSDRVFKKEIHEYLQPHYFNALKALPYTIFQPVLKSYSQLAMQLMRKAFYKDRPFADFSKNELKLLAHATDIYLHENPDNKDMIKLSKDLRSSIHGGGQKTGSELSGALLVKILIFIVILAARISTCSSNKKNNYSISYPQANYQSPTTYMPTITAINRSKMIGTWEANFLMGKDSIPIKRTIALTNSFRGAASWQLFDKAGHEICNLSQTFLWEIFPDRHKPAGNYQMKYKYVHGTLINHNCQGLNPEYDTLAKTIEVNLTGRGFYFEHEPFQFEPETNGAPAIFILSNQPYTKKANN
ncbi:MAG: hypothetical protein R2825_22925 [Saprospiraceae bacterium]